MRSYAGLISAAGGSRWVPSLKSGDISGYIGSMTDGGGLDNAFNDSWVSSSSHPEYDDAVMDGSGYSAWVGAHFNSAFRIARATVMGACHVSSGNKHWIAGNGVSLTINLRASTVSPAGDSAAGVLLGTTGLITDTGAPITVWSNDLSTSYAYVWLELIFPSTTLAKVGEIIFDTVEVPWVNLWPVKSLGVATATASGTSISLVTTDDIPIGDRIIVIAGNSPLTATPATPTVNDGGGGASNSYTARKIVGAANGAALYLFDAPVTRARAAGSTIAVSGMTNGANRHVSAIWAKGVYGAVKTASATILDTSGIVTLNVSSAAGWMLGAFAGAGDADEMFLPPGWTTIFNGKIDRSGTLIGFVDADGWDTFTALHDAATTFTLLAATYK